MRQDVKIIVLLVVLQEKFIARVLLSHGTTTVQVGVIVWNHSIIMMDAPIFAIQTHNVIINMRQAVYLMMKMAAGMVTIVHLGMIQLQGVITGAQ